MTPDPVLLRAHHLLCAKEFRGLGYTRQFAANFARILGELNGRPQTPIRLIAGTDAICAACPWSSAEGCARGSQGEEIVSRLDELVCARLGLKPGAVMSWADLNALLASRADRAWRLSVCRNCSWFGSPCYGEEESIPPRRKDMVKDSFTPACRDNKERKNPLVLRATSDQRRAAYYPAFFPVQRR